MTARQAHLYRGIYPVLYTKPANDVWAEDVDMRVNFALEVGKCFFFLLCLLRNNSLKLASLLIHFFPLFAGKHRKFFKSGDVAIVVTGWRPGSGYTNTMRVVLVP